MEITLKGDAQMESVPSLKDKALRINLNENIYGTFAEIGAGQETVRQFFRAGGASGTIAKAMSAYDKSFSDAIYGIENDRRYVTENRLRKMLTHEVRLIEERISRDDNPNKMFFRSQKFRDTHRRYRASFGGRRFFVFCLRYL